MSNIRVISASAGSGKTYTLAEELWEAITERGVRPEKVVVTTYTIKAAAELQERVRTRLLEDGRVDEAARLMAARIGTVDGVCRRLVREFAFDLGISPEVDGQDSGADEGLDPLLAVAISEVLSPEEEDRLFELGRRFKWSKTPWDDHIQEIIKLARTNAIPARELRRSAERSKASLFRLLGPPARSGRTIDRRLKKEIDTYLKHPNLLNSKFKGDQRTEATLRRVQARLEAGERIIWPDWLRLQWLETTKNGKTREPFERVQEALQAHDVHPGLRDDVGAYLDLVFDVAARAMKRYQSRKAAQGVIDFTDMESLAYDLLRKPELRERLAPNIDLVLVDEFQDTNPLQLAIFLLLAECADASVWVGDQKQSIYRFRGADPSLMESALEQLYPDGDPETLPNSYRSRPALIRLTSTLFTPAFGQQGIPEERVRLKPPPKATYPEDLGAAVEHWRLLDADGEPAGAAAPWDSIASGVRAMLDDPDVRVRDKTTGESRQATPRDIAILPFYRADCTAGAEALERAGVPVAASRTTLLETAEGRLALALLTLWAAPRDTLAAATVTRFLDHAEDPDGFLTRGLARPGEEAFADQPVVRAVRELATERPWLGVLDAFDRVVALAELRDVCRRWGGAEQRLANLEALRGYVASYADGADAEGGAVTPAGAIAWLAANATDEALPATANAVTVVNWHRAKGLEWPIVILLFASRRKKPTDIFGVNAASERPDERLDLEAPLAGRWIRCWVNPYGGQSRGLPFLERLADNEDARRNLRQLKREEVRQLYVIFTRARDRLILAQPGESLIDGTLLEELNVPDADPVVDELEGTVFDWAGLDLPMDGSTCVPAEPVETSVEPDPTYSPREPRDHPPAFQAPSALERPEEPADLGELTRLGKKVRVSGKPVWNNLGQAVHAFLAADRPDSATASRRALAKRLLDRWQVDEHLAADALVELSDRLDQLVRTRWPKAKVYREWLLTMRNAEGTVLRGETDLVLETPKGLVIIDHKAVSGDETFALKKAATYGDQLDAYAETLRVATGLAVVESIIHLPLQGIAAPILPPRNNRN